MKRESRVYEVEGIDKGEHLVLMALSTSEIILTVVEPESYGEQRQAASMALSREQLYGLVSSVNDDLFPPTEDHNDL